MPQPASPSPSATEQPPRPQGVPEGAPESVDRAARGERVTPEEEHGALSYLVGPIEPLEYDVEVQIETPRGLSPITWKVRQMDGRRLLEIENTNTKGTGPFAEVDEVTSSAEILAEATVLMTDSSGRQMRPTDADFRGQYPSPALAIEKRFGRQTGLLLNLASEVRRISGYSNNRVGSAQRALADAAGN